MHQRPVPTNDQHAADDVDEIVRRGRSLIENALVLDGSQGAGAPLPASETIAALERRIEALLRGAFPAAPGHLDLDPGWLAIGAATLVDTSGEEAGVREARRTLRLHERVADLIDRASSEAAESLAGKLGDVLLDRADVGEAVLALAGLPRSELDDILLREHDAVSRGRLANVVHRIRRELRQRFVREVARLARAYDASPSSAVGSEASPSSVARRSFPARTDHAGGPTWTAGA